MNFGFINRKPKEYRLPKCEDWTWVRYIEKDTFLNNN